MLLLFAASERCARIRADASVAAERYCRELLALLQSLASDIAGQDLGTGPVSDVYWLIGNVNPAPPGRAFVFSGPPVYKLQRKITVSVSALAPGFEGGGRRSVVVRHHGGLCSRLEVSDAVAGNQR